MRRVLKPLLATAAARLIAVVVFPTPPFWLATVMIIRTGRDYTWRMNRGDELREASAPSARSGAAEGRRPLHFVLSKVIGPELLEELALALFVVFRLFRRNGLRFFEHFLRDENRRLGAQ